MQSNRVACLLLGSITCKGWVAHLNELSETHLVKFISYREYTVKHSILRNSI